MPQYWTLSALHRIYVAEIVHAAYTESERREVELWKSNGEGAHDWLTYFKHVMHLESNGTATSGNLEQREAMLRSKLKVIGCDITQEHPIGLTEEVQPFTVISTSFCLEVACENYSEYKAAVKKLVKMLKVGGYILIDMVEDQSYYTVGEDKWSVLPLTLAQAKEALEEAGCVVMVTEHEPTPFPDQSRSDEKEYIFLAAYKARGGE